MFVFAVKDSTTKGCVQGCNGRFRDVVRKRLAVLTPNRCVMSHETQNILLGDGWKPIGSCPLVQSANHITVYSFLDGNTLLDKDPSATTACSGGNNKSARRVPERDRIQCLAPGFRQAFLIGAHVWQHHRCMFHKNSLERWVAARNLMGKNL